MQTKLFWHEQFGYILGNRSSLYNLLTFLSYIIKTNVDMLFIKVHTYIISKRAQLLINEQYAVFAISHFVHASSKNT